MYENGRWVSAFFGPSNEMKWLSWVCHGGEHDIWIEREEIEEEEQHHFLWIIYPPSAVDGVVRVCAWLSLLFRTKIGKKR